MNVRSHDSGDGKRIIIRFTDMRGEYSISESEATELRNALTRELGAPQILTDREAMVWAATYVVELHNGTRSRPAIVAARDAVEKLRDALYSTMSDDTRAMLAAMIGGGK